MTQYLFISIPGIISLDITLMQFHLIYQYTRAFQSKKLLRILLQDYVPEFYDVILSVIGKRVETEWLFLEPNSLQFMHAIEKCGQRFSFLFSKNKK